MIKISCFFFCFCFCFCFWGFFKTPNIRTSVQSVGTLMPRVCPRFRVLLSVTAFVSTKNLTLRSFAAVTTRGQILTLAVALTKFLLKLRPRQPNRRFFFFFSTERTFLSHPASSTQTQNHQHVRTNTIHPLYRVQAVHFNHHKHTHVAHPEGCHPTVQGHTALC